MRDRRGRNPLVQIVTNIQYSDYLKLIRLAAKEHKSKSAMAREAIIAHVNNLKSPQK